MRPLAINKTIKVSLPYGPSSAGCRGHNRNGETIFRQRLKIIRGILRGLVSGKTGEWNEGCVPSQVIDHRVPNSCRSNAKHGKSRYPAFHNLQRKETLDIPYLQPSRRNDNGRSAESFCVRTVALERCMSILKGPRQLDDYFLVARIDNPNVMAIPHWVPPIKIDVSGPSVSAHVKPWSIRVRAAKHVHTMVGITIWSGHCRD